MSLQFVATPGDAASHTTFRRPVGISHQAVSVVVASIEALVIIAGSAFGPLAYSWLLDARTGGLDATLSLGVLSSLLYVSISATMRLYSLPVLVDPGRHFRRFVRACGITLLSLTAGLFVLKIGSVFSRGALLFFAAAMLLLCCMTRIGAGTLVRRLIRSNLVLGRPSFLIGDAEELASLTAYFLLLNFGLQEVGRLSLRRTNETLDRYRRDLDDALVKARYTSARELVFATKFDSVERLTFIEQALRTSPLPAQLVPNNVFRSALARHGSDHDARFHLIPLQRAPLSRAEQLVKRVMDISVASISLTFLLPVMLLVACSVKLDSVGPIIFRQRRNGFNRRLFTILKFRTMTVLEDGDTIVQARPGDKRVTRIGQLLRRTSIDELPQLWNVLKGDMSLVGPRPHALAHDNAYGSIIGDYSMRHHVKPGITGWAQVNGFRGETTLPEHMQKRVDLDLWYINNWSIWLDIKIILRTMFEVLGQDAY